MIKIRVLVAAKVEGKQGACQAFFSWYPIFVTSKLLIIRALCSTDFIYVVGAACANPIFYPKYVRKAIPNNKLNILLMGIA
jgi:hypothetical protein